MFCNGAWRNVAGRLDCVCVSGWIVYAREFRYEDPEMGFGRIVRSQSSSPDKAMDGIMHAGRAAANTPNPSHTSLVTTSSLLLLGQSFLFMLSFVPTVVHVSPPGPRRRRGRLPAFKSSSRSQLQRGSRQEQ